MRRNLFILSVAYFIYSHAFSQTLSGFVVDSKTGEKLPNVNITFYAGKVNASTNNYGFYSISLENCPCEVIFSMVGYQKNTVTFKNSDLGGLKYIELESSSNLLDEVTVSSPGESYSKYKPIGLISIPVERLKKVPTLFGEEDILKAMTLLPGITNATEGTSGVLVRGGSPDQNLILLDETPVYNVTHLFGFVSVFNPDAIKDIKLYKAGFPARYSGRLSSVIDITSKEGNTKKTAKELTVGLINSRFLLEGPIKNKAKDGGTFLAAGRLTNLSLLLLPSYLSYKFDKGGQYLNYNLYDLNLKWSKTFKNNGQLLFNTYTGNDVWFVKSNNGQSFGKYRVNWGNVTSSLRYIQPVTQKIFLKNTLAYSRYGYGIKTSITEKKTSESSSFVDYKALLNDVLLKSSVEYYPNRFGEIFLGGELTSHTYKPVNIKSSNPILVADNFQRVRAFEKGAYIELNARPVGWLAINSGFRGAFFTVQDTSYFSPEPRLSVSFFPTKSTGLKFGYSKMGQFLHLLNSSSGGLPNDLWIPATSKLPFGKSTQKSLAITQDFGKMYGLELGAYYKTYSDLVDYGIGQNFIMDFETNYEDQVERGGIGKSYGFEFLLDKRYGELSGWISYSYAKNLRNFAGINDGQWYYANHDRRHIINITSSYKLNERVDLAANWVYQSGSPITVPVAVTTSLLITGNRHPEFLYRERNNFRTPSYHRLDINANFTKETKRNNLRVFSVGVYNVYNHNNSFFLKTNYQPIFGNSRSEFIGWNIKTTKNNFLPFLPYISYSVKFK